MMKVTAIIPAAGVGKRMGGALAKQFLDLGGRPILAHTLGAFERCDLVDDVILVISKANLHICSDQVLPHFPKVGKVVFGGKQRQDSVYEGLKAAGDDTKIVVIHDATRPFIAPEKIVESIKLCEGSRAVVVAVPVKDTIKSVAGGVVEQTLDRRRLWSVQTPQTFHFPLIWEAYQRAYEDAFYSTDDSALVERLGYKVAVLEGSYENIKITTPEDLMLGRMILGKMKPRMNTGHG